MTLPEGYAVRLRADATRLPTDEGGLVLLGGSPFRALRLSARATAVLTGGEITVVDPVSATVAGTLLGANLAFPLLAALPPPAGRLSVVVPVRDRADQLDRCLTALAGLPVVVVDDASLDPAAVARVAARHGADVLALPVNLGPAGARNAGLRTVASAYVAFVDCDVAVTADALLELTRHFADPEVAVVAPRVRGLTTAARPRWFERYDAAASSLDLGPGPARIRPGASVGWLPAACLVARVSELGDGFDEAMRVGEDVDLVWRLDQAGAAVRYDPTVSAAHEVRGSVRGWLGRKVAYGSSAALLSARHGDRNAPAVLGIVTATGSAALLLTRRWSVPVAAVALVLSGRALRRVLPAPAGDLEAFRIAATGLGWGVRQESALLLRHWWPVVALAAPFSRTLRRALVAAVVVDTVVAAREHPDLDLPTVAVGRRLDDLAYGAGLWLGALRARSLRCLAVRRP